MLSTRWLADWGKNVWLERDGAEDHPLQMPSPTGFTKSVSQVSKIRFADKNKKRRNFYGSELTRTSPYASLAWSSNKASAATAKETKGRKGRSLIPTDSEVVEP
jgi:hypothetical protein